MPLDFPSSPTNGQYYNGYIYNAANDTWDSAYAPRAATIPIATPNAIINGAFEINQRNFSSTTGANFTYGFDRWSMQGVNGTVTHSLQTFTPGSAPAPNYEAKNFARVVTSGQTLASATARYSQFIEDVRTFAGQTVTISFWAKAASGTPKIAVEFYQDFGTGGSPSSTVLGAAVAHVTLSTSWARYSATVSIPSISGKTIGTNENSALGVALWVSAGADFNSRTMSLGIQSNTFDVWGVQVEAGAAATDFRRNAPSIQGELAACQRYYWRWTSSNAGERAPSPTLIDSGTLALSVFQNPVAMRVGATAIDFSSLSNWTVRTTGGVTTTPSSFTLANSNVLSTSVDIASTSLTGSFGMLRVNAGTCFIGFSAEL